MKKQMNIGFIVTNGQQVPAWYYETIEKVVEAGFPISFIVLSNLKPDRQKPPLLYSLFEKFENKWFRSSFDATVLRNISHLQNKANTIQIESIHHTTEASLTQLRNLSCDIFYTIEQDIAGLIWLSEYAAHGLWQLWFGQSDERNQTLPAFWEVMKNNAVTGSCLVIYKNQKIYCPYEGTTRTVPHSVKNNFNSIAWKSSSYLPLRLAYITNNPVDSFEEMPGIPASGKKPFPANHTMAYLFVKNAIGYLGYKLKSFLPEKRLILLYSFAEFSIQNLPTVKFTPLALSSKDAFYADPFILKKDGCHYLFFEEMIYSKGKAHISVIVIEADGKIGSPVKVLETDYHLSYPFVFEHEGEVYMMPETASNRTVSLYKAVAFPAKWELVMHLMENVVLFDATLHLKDGLWWLFANSSNHPFVSTNDQLFAFYSDNLFSTNWVPHPLNPIATHAGNCRPAGRLFMMNNKLYRPAQNNASQQYGYGLTINEVEMLTPKAYKEKKVLAVSPEQIGLEACHHLSFSDSLIVIDGIPN